MEPHIGDIEGNLARSLAGSSRRRTRAPSSSSCPNSATPATYSSRARGADLAEPIPDGPTSRAWAAIAADAISTSSPASPSGTARTSTTVAVLIGPNGLIGRYRKTHLWGDEALYFTPGDLGFPVFDTPLGRIGCHICYDCWFPESFRLAALQGAEIVCVPTNWVPIPGQDPKREAMANIIVMAAAHTNSVFVAAADRVGKERGQPFIGQSLIVSHTGWPVAGPASPTAEEIIVARVNLADARRKRNWNAFNQVLRDRRTDLYDEMLGSEHRPGWY